MSIAFLQEEDLGPLGDALGNDLRVERAGKDLGPVLEGPVGGDAGRATALVAVGDDLEGELCLSGVHRQDGEVVDDEERGRCVLLEYALDQAVIVLGVAVLELGSFAVLAALTGLMNREDLSFLRQRFWRAS